MSKVKVLIYDSDEAKGQKIQELLAGIGLKSVHLQVEYAPLPSVVQEHSPSILIIGDPFPGSSIKESLKALRKIPQAKKIPCLLASKIRDPQALRELIAEGVNGIIDFPPTVEGIKRALRGLKKNEQSREILTLLRKASFFEGFTNEEFATLLKSALPKSFHAGDAIIEQNDPADTFYILLKGKVEAVIMEGGKEVLTVPIQEGHSFGEMGVLDKSFRGAYCIAADDCIVLEVGRPILEDESFSLRTRIFAKLTEVLVKRLRAMNDLVRELTTGSKAKDPTANQPSKTEKVESSKAEEAPREEAKKEAKEEAPKKKVVDNDPNVTDLEDMEFEDNGLVFEEEEQKEDVAKNPFSTPTGTCEQFDECIRTQEEYDVFTRKVKLRTEFIVQKIPKNIYEVIHNKLYGYWTGGKLSKFNPHRRWSPKLFTDGSCRLKKSLHVVAVCPGGAKAFEEAYLGLDFTHRAVQLSTSGCSGSFLASPTAIERFFAGCELEKAIKFDLEMPIDRLWKGVDCIEFLTHTTQDIRPYSLFVVFDDESGRYTKMTRENFPEHQILTIIKGYSFDPEDRITLFTQVEGDLMDKELLVQKKDYKGKGFYHGETFFLPDLSLFYKGTDRLSEVGYIFGTLGALALMGPDYSGVTWGSKGGAEGAVKAARAMYGMKGAGSAKELADAINWADE